MLAVILLQIGISIIIVLVVVARAVVKEARKYCVGFCVLINSLLVSSVYFIPVQFVLHVYHFKLNAKGLHRYFTLCTPVLLPSPRHRPRPR